MIVYVCMVNGCKWYGKWYVCGFSACLFRIQRIALWWREPDFSRWWVCPSPLRSRVGQCTFSHGPSKAHARYFRFLWQLSQLGYCLPQWVETMLSWCGDSIGGTIQHRWPDFRVCFWWERWGSLAAMLWMCALFANATSVEMLWKCMKVLNGWGGAVANNWYQRSASPKWMRCHNGLGTVHRISTAVNVCECIAIKCLRQNADEWFEITRMPLVIYSQPVKTSAAFRILWLPSSQINESFYPEPHFRWRIKEAKRGRFGCIYIYHIIIYIYYITYYIILYYIILYFTLFYIIYYILYILYI